jgi:hypothetical protein
VPEGGTASARLRDRTDRSGAYGASPNVWIVLETGAADYAATASSARIAAANASMSASVVSNAHIQRTSRRAASQS